MKIDFSQKMKDPAKSEPEDMKATLGQLALLSLNAPNLVNGQAVPHNAAEAFRRGSLYHKIAPGGEVELTSEDVTLIKQGLHVVASNWGVFAAANLLEGKNADGSEAAKK